ncbi:MAG: IclR family transcriptional regulator, partial [Actinomycetota bacterium]
MVQSVERAFRVLAQVARGRSGVTEIAEALGLPKSTVARMLASLESIGAIERDGDRYRVGAQLASIAATVSREQDLVELARPDLLALVADLGEDVGVGLPDGPRVHYVAQESAANDVRVRNWTGTRAPLHTTSSGLVLLAARPDDEIDAYLARPLERLTERTVTDPAAIRERVADIRRRGYAWVREEFADGISSVAAPVRSGDAVVAAVHAHGPAFRF